MPRGRPALVPRLGPALHEEELEEEHVRKTLKHFGVKRIVIGHTPTLGVIVPRFEGSVILADVGLSRDYGARLACLEVKNGKAYAIHRGKRLELPESNGESFIAYLEAITSLEPGNEATQQWISRLKKQRVTNKSKQTVPPVNPID